MRKEVEVLCSLRQRELNEFERVFTVSSCERRLFLLEFVSLSEEAGEGDDDILKFCATSVIVMPWEEAWLEVILWILVLWLPLTCYVSLSTSVFPQDRVNVWFSLFISL